LRPFYGLYGAAVMHVIGRINLQLHATMKLAADIVQDFNWCSQTLSRPQHDPVSSSAFLRETSSWSLKMQYLIVPFSLLKIALVLAYVLQRQQRTICFGKYCMDSVHLYCGRVWGNCTPFITSASSFPGVCSCYLWEWLPNCVECYAQSLYLWEWAGFRTFLV